MKEKQEFHYVYLTINNITKQQYVGDRTSTKEPQKDRYFGSGREIKKAINEYKRKNFSKIILEKCLTRQEAGDKQEYYIRLYKTHISQGGYNVNWNGGTCNGERKHAEESKELMREKAKKREKQSIETRRKRSESLKGRTGKDNTNFGKKQSIETKRKRSESLKGHIESKETRQKISNSLKGHFVSSETKQNKENVTKDKFLGIKV
jgi:group I intron endonuclease